MRSLSRSSLSAPAMLAAALLVLAGCSAGSTTRTTAPQTDVTSRNRPPLVVPPGVDSTVALISDSLAFESFVSFEAEQTADSLTAESLDLVDTSDEFWAVLEIRPDSSATTTPEQQTEFVAAFNEGARPLVEMQRLDPSTMTTDELRARQAQLLDGAQSGLERAVEINPYDAQAKLVLARVYSAQAQRLRRDQQYGRAVEVLERLLRLNQGEHVVYKALADNYYLLEDWQRAAQNYAEAERYLAAQPDLDLDVPEGQVAALTPDDSLRLFTYVYYQGRAQTNLRDAGSALSTFARAARIAPTRENEDAVQTEIDWIEWDGGNIAATFARDSVLALVDDGDFAGAEQGFRSLRETVRTQIAVDEVDWRLAIVEARQDRPEAAAQRLQSLVDRTPTDPDTGVPVDSTYERYFETYGTVAYNLGTTNFRVSRNKRAALSYFRQAADVAWSGRAKAYLEAAKILRSNTRAAIAHAEEALVYTDGGAVRSDALYLLVQLYRQSGDLTQATQYAREYKALQASLSAPAPADSE